MRNIDPPKPAATQDRFKTAPCSIPLFFSPSSVSRHRANSDFFNSLLADDELHHASGYDLCYPNHSLAARNIGDLEQGPAHGKEFTVRLRTKVQDILTTVRKSW